ncbi:SDR family oxidoreductase [Flavobacterium foetidum]|uniref:SDR family oxidoreductase n=1 Tax=Flavobacterium foetidum TaxID=2026681 RepID=UPI0010750D19|nr:SDR family oxidoreductase [Flavobacterium foetidum]KAF2517159.1 SDR family oxidoreductase [Flavobacterium foetidum]
MKNLSDLFEQNIKQKRIVITGGTTGIGKAIADLMISLGGRVLIFGRDHEDFNNAVADIKSNFPDAAIYGTPADITHNDDVEKIWELVDQNLGGIDILINNAALAADGITECDWKEWKYIVDTNVSGYITFAQQAVLRMTPQKSGHIINIGSMSAETNSPESTVYVATKAALRGFSTALRREINSKGIKVSLIEPGAVTSDMQPGTKEEHQQKIEKLEMLEAEDIAMSVLFCLAQPKRCDIVTMQIRPHLQTI